MQLSLEVFPRMKRKYLVGSLPTLELNKGYLARGRLPVLELNKKYLAQKGVPLFRIVDQENRVSALIDLLSFGLYVLRVVLQVHMLTFRKPDPPAERPPQRLPRAVTGLPFPQIDWLLLDHVHGAPVRICLTRYDGSSLGAEGSGAPNRPVLLIHGYSASGTTFVHEAVPGNLVEKLCKRGRDVWVLDMRSSAALPSCTRSWSFEQMANEDIPAAINHVLVKTKKPGVYPPRVDVVCQCMGCAMFSMAVLGDEHKKLYKSIGRTVFCQVGPALILSPSNVLGAFIMRYVRQFLPLEDYSFSPQKVSTAGQLLDRALSAMSIPIEEYRRENPFWPPGKATPWVGTRHRMDVLYSRTFSLNNLSDQVLDKIDDFFGPLSVETVSQVIHFADFNALTDRKGINRFVDHGRVKRLRFPLMSIHGEDNGLVDVATLRLMRDLLRNCGVPHLNDRGTKTASIDRSQSVEEITNLIEKQKGALRLDQPSYLTWRIARHGHQDCLIGKYAGDICGVIAKYLCMPDA